MKKGRIWDKGERGIAMVFGGQEVDLYGGYRGMVVKDTEFGRDVVWNVGGITQNGGK